MLALGIAVAKLPREQFAKHGITRELLSEDKASRLREACISGQVKTIAKQPEPYEHMMIAGGYGVCRYPYGVNLSEVASWYGKKSFTIAMPAATRVADLTKISKEQAHE